MARMSRRSRPELEGLEGRRLLNARFHVRGSSVNADALGSPPSITNRFIGYSTPTGSRVTVSLVGKGSLLGSSVDPDGGLNLMFSNTRATTKIFVGVKGGTAPLKTVHDAALSLDNVTGVGGHLLGTFAAPGLDLVENGNINLSSGIGRIQLHSVGRNTQIHLRELPQVAAAPGGIITSTSASPNTAVPIPLGTAAVAASTPAPAFAPATYNSAGRVLSYTNEATGGSILSGISGQFAPTLNQGVLFDPTRPGAAQPPPGVIIQIGMVDAGVKGGQPIGSGQIFGYDGTANKLIRFDERTGAALQSIDVGGAAKNVAGVGLGRNGRELVVLLGRGTTVQAFDAVTGAAVGQFSTANLGSIGFNDGIDGVAFNGTKTFLTDASGQFPPTATERGIAVAVDVTTSLSTGVAQVVGSPFLSAREFEFAGGATGVAGVNNIFIAGAAHFDAFQPNLTQFGVLTLSAGGSPLRETARTALTNLGQFINAGPSFVAKTGISDAGSVEGLIARVTGVVNGQNIVTLYAPNNIATQGSLTLNDPNRLVGLSESFHPEVAGSALIDVQGNIQSFSAASVHGLALNDSGNFNIARIGSATDSTIVAQPFGHLDLLQRNNLVIVTPTRSVADRAGVTVDPALRPLGPLSLPG